MNKPLFYKALFWTCASILLGLFITIAEAALIEDLKLGRETFPWGAYITIHLFFATIVGLLIGVNGYYKSKEEEEKKERKDP